MWTVEGARARAGLTGGERSGRWPTKVRWTVKVGGNVDGRGVEGEGRADVPGPLEASVVAGGQPKCALRLCPLEQGVKLAHTPDPGERVSGVLGTKSASY
eukprot:6162764-Pyramimonas_sp.AAC.5